VFMTSDDCAKLPQFAMRGGLPAVLKGLNAMPGTEFNLKAGDFTGDSIERGTIIDATEWQ
jgi:hypothetical protein